MNASFRFAALAAALTASAAFSFSSGISSANFSPAAGCNGCHTGGVAPTVTLTPAQQTLAAGASMMVSLTVAQNNGLQTHAGLNLAATDGTFSVTDPATKLLDGEITHTGAKPLTNGTVTFTALWTAPAGQSQSVTLTGWGNNVDLMNGFSGDFASVATSVVTVTCVAATEVCDGVDNDCDTLTDEEPTNCPAGQTCSNGACTVVDAGVDGGEDGGFEDAGVEDAGFEDAGSDAGMEADAGVSDAGVQCGAGEVLCSGVCVNPLTHGANCGACGNACSATTVCSAGSCESSCANSETACGQSCVNLQTSVTNCGSCGNECLFDGASSLCEAGVCKPGVCSAGSVDVDQDPANGCECSGARAELCNGFDDDCDGQVDEDDICEPEGCGCSSSSGVLALFAGALTTLALRRRRR